MALDPTLAAGLIEAGKIILQGYFSLMKQTGKTPEEIDALYTQERAAFDNKRPEDLPDV